MENVFLKAINPTVSVVMSVYKESIEWLKVSIESIVNQTFNDFEFIIVNDCPGREESNKLLLSYQKKDKRIVIINNEINIGLTKSLNKGLAIAKGKYIARMDADDVSALERIQCEVDFLNTHKEFDLCHTDYRLLDEYGNSNQRDRTIDVPSQTILFREEYIVHPSVMFRRELLKLRKPFYNESFKTAQDYELWSFLTIKGVRFGYVNRVLFDYRLSSSQLSSKSRSGQLSNGRIIRRQLISEYLNQHGINSCIPCDINFLLNQTRRVKTSSYFQKEAIKNIRYIALYTLAINDGVKAYPKLIRSTLLKYDIKHTMYVLLAPLLGNRWSIFEY